MSQKHTFQQPDSALPQVVPENQLELSYRDQAPLETTPHQPSYGAYYGNNLPVSVDSFPSKVKGGDLILGLRKPTFFLSLSLIAIVIMGAVGGGVGGSIAVENARK